MDGNQSDARDAGNGFRGPAGGVAEDDYMSGPYFCGFGNGKVADADVDRIDAIGEKHDVCFIRKEIRTTVFTVATRAYEVFVLPFISSVLFFNDDTRVEICLEDTCRFEVENARALAVMRKHFGKDGSRYLLRDGNFYTAANSIRFLETPKGAETEYVFITDVDGFILQSGITDFHVARMVERGLPYSNVLQAGKYGNVLSGRHFSKWNAFYPQIIPERKIISLDLLLLKEMVRSKGYGLPPESSKGEYHPFFGIHISPNQIPVLLSQVRSKRTLFCAYRRLVESPIWRELFPLLSFQTRMVINMIELAQLIVADKPKDHVDHVVRLKSEKADSDRQVARLKSEKAERDQSDQRIRRMLARPWYRRVWSAE